MIQSDWTLKELLDATRPWQVPEGCRVTFDWDGDNAIFILERPCGCYVNRRFHRSQPAAEALNLLDRMAVRLETRHADCQFSRALQKQLNKGGKILSLWVELYATGPAGWRRRFSPWHVMQTWLATGRAP
jgi:hypothetical protein